MKALISVLVALALLIGGAYLVVSSAAGVLTSISQDDTWWYIAWFCAGALCCFLAIPAGLAAGATGNRYRLQDPQDLAYGSAANGYDERRDDDDYQRPAVTGHFASQEEREAAIREYQRKVWLEEIAGSEAASGAPEDQSRWWEKPAIRRIDDTQPPEQPKKDDGNLRDLNEDDWRKMGL